MHVCKPICFSMNHILILTWSLLAQFVKGDFYATIKSISTTDGDRHHDFSCTCFRLFIRSLLRMPNGGSIALIMIPVILMSIRWGVSAGFIIGVLIAGLQLMNNPIIATPVQGFLDYFVASVVICLSGLFSGSIKKPFRIKAKETILLYYPSCICRQFLQTADVLYFRCSFLFSLCTKGNARLGVFSSL